MFHPEAEFDPVTQSAGQVELRRSDLPPQVAAGDQLEQDVGTSLDHLNRVRLYDVRVIPEVDPEVTFG